jgi:phosphohistidine phosphatase
MSNEGAKGKPRRRTGTENVIDTSQEKSSNQALRPRIGEIMNLYLVQHGDALPKEQDPDRPLSDLGRQRVGSVARVMKSASAAPKRVLHSGKTRARQTAEIIAETLAIEDNPESLHGINPLDPVGPIADATRSWDRDVMVVGHLPHLGKLAAVLVTGNENGSVVTFTPGTVVCLQRHEDGGYAVAWMLRPELCEASSV